MVNKLSVREGILDALKDVVSSIVQIQEYLNFLGHVLERDDLKKELVNLLHERSIKITHPTEINVNEFINSDNSSLVNFWFELSKKGQSEWNRI